MATTNPEVSPAAERIVKSFDGRDKTSNFEDIARDIYNLNRDQGFGMGASLDYINKQVNMKDLGFSEDFEILGVESNGSVRTRGTSGQIQLRDGMSLEVKSAREADVYTREINGRKFTENGDGTNNYTVKSGDTLSAISAAVMRDRLGRKPTAAEISEAYNQIALANEISDPNKISIGQELKIPQGYDQSSKDPYKPIDSKTGEVTRDTAMPRGEDDVFNAMAAPGLPGTSDSWTTPQVESVPRPDGSVQKKVTGQLDGFGTNNPEYTGYQSQDANGRITDSHIEYSYGANIEFDNGTDNKEYILGVKSVDTVVNNSGEYVSTIRTEEGQVWRSVTKSDGKVISFKQV